MPLFFVTLALALPVLLVSVSAFPGSAGAQALGAGLTLALAGIVSCAAREARGFAGFCRASAEHGDESMLEVCIPAADTLRARARPAR